MKKKHPLLRNLNNLINVCVSKPGPPKCRTIPTCIVINARSLAKPDASPALYLELKNHDVDLGIVTETWLKSTIPKQAISPGGFSVKRKDRPFDRQGGGVRSCLL